MEDDPSLFRAISWPAGLVCASYGTQHGELVYARPKPPAKAEGRRGTRRAWKRANPPDFYMLVTSTLNGELTGRYLMKAFA